MTVETGFASFKCLQIPPLTIPPRFSRRLKWAAQSKPATCSLIKKKLRPDFLNFSCRLKLDTIFGKAVQDNIINDAFQIYHQ
ncbi:hypothetical protein PZB74_06075 [Porifericola rhodea]|uniref:hypothetical protein n=1 Tax=Porifericola rhodea TaxID=930972 RepID=UPI002666A207|nr:hypothetical protein [Porifericola rhodea]WKN33990.1 hypothetical protein PZB74_06075 [Porifericola rhodea]